MHWRATSRALAIERGINNVGPISTFTLKALADAGIAAHGAGRMPLACADDDLHAADLIVAVKEAEHRILLRERHAGWEDRVVFWHVHDIDFAAPDVALAELAVRVGELVTQLVKRLEPASNLS